MSQEQTSGRKSESKKNELAASMQHNLLNLYQNRKVGVHELVRGNNQSVDDKGKTLEAKQRMDTKIAKARLH